PQPRRGRALRLQHGRAGALLPQHAARPAAPDRAVEPEPGLAARHRRAHHGVLARRHAAHRGAAAVGGARGAMKGLRMAALAGALSGCTAVREMWRPEGDGGWTVAERRAAVGALAPAAGVVDPLAPRPTPSAPQRYDLARALAEAAHANRAIAAAG